MTQDSPNLQELYSQEIRNNPIVFINEILGLPLHKEQLKWITNAKKKINILRPGNRWGKSLITACLHIYHGMTKIQLQDNISTPEEWLNQPYETLNFGPDYEQAREVGRLARDIVQGRIVLPKEYQKKWGKTNRSQLKDWAILDDKVDAQIMPQLMWASGGKLLIRSYHDMGAAFKAKALAFISGDECADIQELWTFTNITLLPRLVSLRGILHFVGTVQPEGYDYIYMIELAEEDMEKKGKVNMYVQKGSMYDNPFLAKDEIETTEAVADKDLRRQIIKGEYVEKGNKYFGNERVSNAVDRNLELIPKGIDTQKYIISADFAGGDSVWTDFTVICVIDYTEEPYKLVHFFRIKGRDMPIPMQYKEVGNICEKFKGRLVIDATALGGKNAMAFLKHLKPVPLQMSSALKGEMLSTLKNAQEVFNLGYPIESEIIDDFGIVKDLNPKWGLVRIPDIQVLEKELKDYKLADKKLRTDCVMSLAQAIFWIEMRRPKQEKNKMVPWDLAASS